jgi:hypothetical protein
VILSPKMTLLTFVVSILIRWSSSAEGIMAGVVRLVVIYEFGIPSKRNLPATS